MLAGRAESGPRAGRGSGRWSLQVPSKCFESTATERRNPSKRTERSLILAHCTTLKPKVVQCTSLELDKLFQVPNGPEIRFKFSE